MLLCVDVHTQNHVCQLRRPEVFWMYSRLCLVWFVPKANNSHQKFNILATKRPRQRRWRTLTRERSHFYLLHQDLRDIFKRCMLKSLFSSKRNQFPLHQLNRANVNNFLASRKKEKRIIEKRTEYEKTSLNFCLFLQWSRVPNYFQCSQRLKKLTEIISLMFRVGARSGSKSYSFFPFFSQIFLLQTHISFNGNNVHCVYWANRIDKIFWRLFSRKETQVKCEHFL